MKHFLNFVASIIIDLIIICILTFAFINFAQNSSGFMFPNAFFMSEKSLFATLVLWFKPFVVIAILYLIISIICKNSIGLLAMRKGKFSKAIKLFFATIIDYNFVLLLALILDFWLQKLFFYDFFALLIGVFILYSFTTVLFNGISLGKWLLGIKINSDSRFSILKYTFYKILFIIVLPLLIFRFFGIIDFYALFLDIILCTLFFYIFSIIILKKPIWAYFSKINYSFENQKLKFVFVKFLILILIIVTGFYSLKYFNNKNHSDEDTLFGFNFPYEFKKYPNEKAVKTYTDFLQTQNQSPKEYILNLFKDKDIVILEEAYHGESTQWDMIYDIVSDTAFIKNVGNIFTEYGSAMHQNKIDAFLNTTFPNDTILEKETACLMHYMTGGFYYFIKNLNLLNSKLPDSLKVREHYCDVIDWDYFPSFKISDAGYDRDSLMAQITINWYNKQLSEGKRHKCLVVTNTRHANGYAGGVDYVKSKPSYLRLTKGNQGQYIWEKFPEKTAAVMQWKYVSSRALFLPIFRPVNNGKWDLAFEINQNKPVGFDLKNSPFGNDMFDSYPLRGAKTTLKYEDIYTGLIFNKPYLEQNGVEYPYSLYATTQEAKLKGFENDSKYLSMLQWLIDEPYLEKNMRWAKMISISNFAGIFVFLMLSVMSLVGYLGYFIVVMCKRRTVHRKIGAKIFR